MTPELSAEQLRAELQPLTLEPATTAGQEAYRQFYGLDQLEHSGVRARLGQMTVGDYQVVTQLWWPESPRATLVLLHGYYDHMGLYRHAIDWALEQGFAVLGCDLPGHGLSSGDPASINEFAEYQDVLRGLLDEARRLQLPAPWHLMGQSTGAAIIIDFLLHLEHPLPELGRPILLAPLVRPWLWSRSRLTYLLLRYLVRQIPRRFSVNSGDPAFLQFLEQDPLQARILPVSWVGALDRWIPHIEAAPSSPLQPLIVQGEQDLTVDWQHNLEVLRDKFAQPEILSLPEARHHLINEQQALRDQYFGWLREQLQGTSEPVAGQADRQSGAHGDQGGPEPVLPGR